MRFFWHSFVRETYSLSAMVYVKPFIRLEFVSRKMENVNARGPYRGCIKEYVCVYITDKNMCFKIYLCV